MAYISLIGAGTIGLSFAALHLSRNPAVRITIYDPRPDLESHINSHLLGYLPSHMSNVAELYTDGRLKVASSLEEACSSLTTIVQEQGPETVDFKARIWPEIEKHVSPECLLWSSTSGIPASAQSRGMKNPERLVVAHPFNPPHIMPLVEVVPGPATPEALVEAAVAYFKSIGQAPVVVKKEKIGFVANRLAFRLLREACGLVAEDVVSASDLDVIVENSIGLRWSVTGPFKSYHYGGAEGGLGTFLEKIGGSIEGVWEDHSTNVKFGEGNWQEKVVADTSAAYGPVSEQNYAERDRITRAALEAVCGERQALAGEQAERAG